MPIEKDPYALYDESHANPKPWWQTALVIGLFFSFFLALGAFAGLSIYFG